MIDSSPISQLRRPSGRIYRARILSPEEGYDVAAPYYDDWYWRPFWEANELPIVRAAMCQLTDVRSALDVGTGTGAYLAEVASRGLSATGVDISEGMLARAHLRIGDIAELIQARVESMPLRAESFDLITACRMLTHIADLKRAALELTRVASRGAHLIVTDVSASHLYTRTRIPTPNGDVHIATYKRTTDTVIDSFLATGAWKVASRRSICYQQLRWKPSQSDYPTMDETSTRPIFYFALLQRLP